MPDDTAGLRQAVVELAEAAARPDPGDPLPAGSRAPLATLSPAQKRKDRILCDAWDALLPDQRAALRIAEQIARQDHRSPAINPLGCLCACIGSVLAIWVVVIQPLNTWTFLYVSAVVIGLSWSNWKASAHERQVRVSEEAADVRVAQAFDDPDRYLEALNALASAELAAWESLQGEARVSMDFTRRRDRLRDLLGINSPMSPS